MYCVVSFCSTSSTRICVARFVENPNKENTKRVFAVLEDVVFMLSYVSRWGKNRSGFNRPPTHPWNMFSLENQFYFDENFMKSLPTHVRASNFPFRCVERRRIFSFSTPSTFYLFTLVTSPHFRLFSEQLLCFMYSWPRFCQISLIHRAKRRHSMPK